MNVCKIIIIFAIFCLTAACDDGKIYPDNSGIAASGLTITMKGDITGCDDYSDTQYSVVIAVFEKDNDFAVMSKNLNDGNEDVTLTNVDRNVSSVEVCIINPLRKRVITLLAQPVDGASDQMVFDTGTLNVSPFAAIVSEIFAKNCLQCHGATDRPAAGLDLSADKAYADIVNAESKVIEGELIVNPGDASASTLWQVVATDISETWRFDHSNLLTSEKVSFIESWINSGAND